MHPSKPMRRLDSNVLWLRRNHKVYRENCCIFYVWALFYWLRGLPPKHAYRSQQTVTHAFVSAHVHHSYHSLSFLSPPHLPNPLLVSQTLLEQTNEYPPISAVSLRPLWTFRLARKYISFNYVTRKGFPTGAVLTANVPSSEYQESFHWYGPHYSWS